ncbi:MAG: hypothetical protein Q7U13_00075 [Rhodoferax sp.]|nr:hypothetical protein [Rhodoferax sp.]
MNLLKPIERDVLLATHRAQHGSLLTLRKNLNLNLESFAEAIGALESKGLITRTGLKVGITPQGLHALNSRSATSPEQIQKNYTASVSVPKLAVTDFYLPNREKFLDSLKKSN